MARRYGSPGHRSIKLLLDAVTVVLRPTTARGEVAQAIRNGVEESRQVSAQEQNGGDNRDRDQSHHESVLDGGRSLLVLEQGHDERLKSQPKALREEASLAISKDDQVMCI
jgi:hypothetical protein